MRRMRKSYGGREEKRVGRAGDYLCRAERMGK
jgi:hypothetical protein